MEGVWAAVGRDVRNVAARPNLPAALCLHSGAEPGDAATGTNGQLSPARRPLSLDGWTDSSAHAPARAGMGDQDASLGHSSSAAKVSVARRGFDNPF